jgi:hypothetical protein
VTPEKRWKRMWVANFGFLAALSVALLVLVLLRYLDIAFATTFVVILAAAAIVMYQRQKSNGQSRPDERIRRLTFRSMGISWQATVFAGVALYLLEFYRIVSLSAIQTLGLLLAFMYVSWLLILLILRLRGDVAE